MLLRVLPTLLALGALMTLAPAQAVEMDCTGETDIVCYDGNDFCLVYVHNSAVRACAGHIVDQGTLVGYAADPASACRLAGPCAMKLPDVIVLP